MSIDIPTELLTASSGSVGDTVFSHNQFGPYTRARTSPADPATALQLVVRQALTTCITAWNATLTPAQRAAWNEYALAVPTIGRTGRRTNPGGLGAFVRANVPRLQSGPPVLALVRAAPTLLTSAFHTPLTRVVLNINDDTIHPFIEPADHWAGTLKAAMLFYVSAPTALTVHFWAGPYRYAGRVLGLPSRPTTPATIPLPVPAGPNQRVFVRARVTAADARLSPSTRLPADVVAQVPPNFLSAEIEYGTGSTMYLNVTFDSPIRNEAHDATNWIWRYNNYMFYPHTAVTHDNGIRLTALWGPRIPGVQNIWYLPPPFDVNGLLTGLPVALFFLPW